MTNWTTRCMIVTASAAPMARDLCEKLSGWGDMFVTPLSPTGDPAQPVTHYISNGAISEEFAALLESADAIFAASQSVGLPHTLDDVRTLLGDCAISTDLPYIVMNAMGLKVVCDVE